MLFAKTTLNCGGQLLSLEKPVVMGILNVTPDSFYDGGAYRKITAIIRQTEKMVEEGATIIDIGGMSSRPGAAIISVQEELERVLPAVEVIRKQFPQVIISIDTIRSKVARAAVEKGANMINDISAGKFDQQLFQTVADLKVPYVLMHMQGKPQNMQNQPAYQQVGTDILDFFIKKVGILRTLGVVDIILDPGFGFGKTVEHNYQLLNQLHAFQLMELPILVGLSRKSMIYKPLKINASQALNGTSVLNLFALQQGAKILRVHDVKEAMEVVQLYQLLREHQD